jgi:hypothetical protein
LNVAKKEKGDEREKDEGREGKGSTVRGRRIR